MSFTALALAFLIGLAVNTDNPLLHWGHEEVLTFSSNPQLWVESRVLHMNYACLDARMPSNTSAIIIETIEKTIPDGSIIRQQEGETWSGRSPALPCQPNHHVHGGDLYRHVLVPFGALLRAGRHAESGVYVCKAVCVQLFGKDMANFLGEITSQTVACSQLKNWTCCVWNVKVSRSAGISELLWISSNRQKASANCCQSAATLD